MSYSYCKTDSESSENEDDSYPEPSDYEMLWCGMKNKFKIFRTERVCCDIVFVGSNDVYYAHQSILVAVSDYFRTLVKHREKISDVSSQTKEIRVNLSDMGIEDTNFVTLLDVIYDGLEDFGDNAISLLFDASKLLMKDVAKPIVKFIVKNDLCEKGKNIDNFFRLVALPLLEEYYLLKFYLWKCLRKNFATLSSMKEFYELSLETLNDLSLFTRSYIGRNFYSSPITFINFVGKWVSYDINHRMILVRKIIKYLNPEDTTNYESLPDTIIDDVVQRFKTSQLNVSFFRFVLMGALYKTVCSWFDPKSSLVQDNGQFSNWFDLNVKPEEILVDVEKNLQTTNSNDDDIKIQDDVNSDVMS